MTTRNNVATALEAYDAIRRPMAYDVQRRTAKSGDYMQLLDPEFLDLARDDPPISRLKDLGDSIFKNWDWAWTTDAKYDKQRAEELLEDKLRSKYSNISCKFMILTCTQTLDRTFKRDYKFIEVCPAHLHGHRGHWLSLALARVRICFFKDTDRTFVKKERSKR